jgi:hypothetical protein
MFLTCHLLVGAAIGKALRRPPVAYPAAYVSHYVLDAIPHLDGGGLLGCGGAPTPLMKGLGAVDLLIGAFILWLLIRRQPDARRMAWAAFCAILVDVIDYVPPWCEWVHHSPWTCWFSTVHDLYHHGLTRDQWVVGFGTQLAVALGSAWFIAPRALRQSHPEALEKRGLSDDTTRA